MTSGAGGTTRYDEGLGEALRALPVPEHAADFAARLRAALEAVRAGGAPLHRRGRAIRRPQDASARRRVGAVLAVAATALAAVLAAMLLAPGSTRTPAGSIGAEPATAAQLGARVTRALAGIDALSAVLVVRDRPSSEAPVRTTRSRLLLTSGGDERLDGDGRDRAYHADSGTETVLADPDVPGMSVTTDLAPGAPDRMPDRAIDLQLGAVARALRAAGSRGVARITYGGRPAWRIAVRAATDVHALAGETGDRLDVTVDGATGIPLRVRETYRGRFVAERRLEHVRIDPSIPPAVFAPQPPAGEVLRADAGFHHVALGDAASQVGYAPLAPRSLPAGFVRAETAVAASAAATGAEGMNPPSAGVVSTAYRRGLQLVVVSTRRAGTDRWADPLAAPEGFLVHPRRVCFRHGALAGRCGRELIDPRATPHVWVLAGGLVVTVAGDLTGGELLRTADSLARVR